MDIEIRGGTITNCFTQEEVEYLKRADPLNAYFISKIGEGGRGPVIRYPADNVGFYLQDYLEKVIRDGGFEITGDL